MGSEPHDHEYEGSRSYSTFLDLVRWSNFPTHDSVDLRQPVMLSLTRWRELYSARPPEGNAVALGRGGVRRRPIIDMLPARHVEQHRDVNHLVLRINGRRVMRSSSIAGGLAFERHPGPFPYTSNGTRIGISRLWPAFHRGTAPAPWVKPDRQGPSAGRRTSDTRQLLWRLISGDQPRSVTRTALNARIRRP